MSKKVNNNKAYISYRKDRDAWVLRYYEEDKKTGKKIKKGRNFNSKEEAEGFLENLMYQKSDPLYIKYNGIPLIDFMKSNLELKRDTNQIASATYGRNLQTIAQIEKYDIANKKIENVTEYELQEFMNEHKYMSNSTIDKLYHLFKSTFTMALNKGYIKRNPMVTVIKPRSIKENKEVRALTVDEQKMFTDYLLSKKIDECKYKNVYLIQMYCGLRVGEVLALKNTDINLKTKKLQVNRTLTRDEYGNAIMGKTTKTYAGKRIVPIPEFILPHIMEQLNYSYWVKENNENLLFKYDDRKYVDRGNVNNELRRLLKRHFQIDDITTHSLRHTYGTRCIESGMQAVVVQKFMGHTDVGITLNTYTSVYDKFKEKEVEKINKYYIDEKINNTEIDDCEYSFYLDEKSKDER